MDGLITYEESPDAYFIKYLDPTEGLILDAGCGLGSTTLFLASKILSEEGHTKVIGIDIDVDDIEYAKDRAKMMRFKDSMVEFRTDDFLELGSIGDNSLNHAYFRNTMCWLMDEELLSVLLAGLSRKLVDNAMLTIWEQQPIAETGIATVSSIWGQVWELQKQLRKVQGKPYLNEWSSAMLSVLLTDSDFTIIERVSFRGEEIDMETTRSFIHKLLEQCSTIPSTKALTALEFELGKLLTLCEGIPRDTLPGSFIIHARLLKGRSIHRLHTPISLPTL